jgi:hypothetical protein
LSEAEKNELHARFYKPFHGEIVTQLRPANKPVIVVAWDNTAHYVIGKNKSNEEVTMPSFVLSNRGGEETAEADDEPTSCSAELLTTLKYYFEHKLAIRTNPLISISILSTVVGTSHATIPHGATQHSYAIMAFSTLYSPSRSSTILQSLTTERP